jgi:hypothetical protein
MQQARQWRVWFIFCRGKGDGRIREKAEERSKRDES